MLPDVNDQARLLALLERRVRVAQPEGLRLFLGQEKLAGVLSIREEGLLVTPGNASRSYRTLIHTPKGTVADQQVPRGQ